MRMNTYGIDYYEYYKRQIYHALFEEYINDNYGGGEICFPDKDITIKQEKNSAVLFDGNTIYQINPITYGKKYMLTIFGK